VSAFCSMFSQLLKLFPRTEFQALVTRTHAERHARGSEGKALLRALKETATGLLQQTRWIVKGPSRRRRTFWQG
jgi:hypothetical protein